MTLDENGNTIPQSPVAQVATTSFEDMVAGSGEEDADIEEAHEEKSTAIQLANFAKDIVLEAGDITVPRVRLAQGLTQEVQDGTAKPGEWILTGFDPKTEIIVVPLLFARNRTLREKDGGAILCRSTNAVEGVGEPGGICANCPYNQWTDAPGGKRNPPVCTFSYVYIVYIVDWDTMGLLEFKRTSITAGKTLNTISAQRGLVKFAVKLKSSKQTGQKGTFFSMVVQPVQTDPKWIIAAQQFAGK